MKSQLRCIATLLALSAASAGSMAQSSIARVTNQTYGYYYANNTVELPFNGSTQSFFNQEYYASPNDYTQGSSAAAVPAPASFSATGVGNPAFNLPTVQMEGYASTDWKHNHARVGISGFDPVVTNTPSTVCTTVPGSGTCLPGSEFSVNYTTVPTAYAFALSTVEEIYQTGGAAGLLSTSYNIHGQIGPQSSTSGTPSGSAQLVWSQRDFNYVTLASLSANYYAASDTWELSTYSRATGQFTTLTGTGTLFINENIDVQRSYALGDAVYVNSYLQTYVEGNGLVDAANTVTLTGVDVSSGTRLLALSGTNYGNLLTFGGGAGSGTVCTDLSCVAGTGGGGGGGIPPVPEPATSAMLLAGLGLVYGIVRRRRSSAGA